MYCIVSVDMGKWVHIELIYIADILGVNIEELFGGLIQIISAKNAPYRHIVFADMAKEKISPISVSGKKIDTRDSSLFVLGLAYPF